MTNKPYKTDAIVYPTNNCQSPTYILIDGEYFASDYVASERVAKGQIGKRYLTKRFEHTQDTTKIVLSDGREYIHPHPSNHDTLVFSYRDNRFLPIDLFDEMIENIPLEGTYEDLRD